MIGAPETYLTQWSDAGWLLRFITADSPEPQYQLTRFSEDVISFVDEALSRESRVVGTESRLRMVMETFADIVRGASADPERRLASLREDRAKIDAEIAEIDSGKSISVYGDAQIRERFQTAIDLLTALQSDFRDVEERFHEIAGRVQQQQTRVDGSRGEILGQAMDAEDLLRQADEGISIYAFVAFLFSPSQQSALYLDSENAVQKIFAFADSSRTIACDLSDVSSPDSLERHLRDKGYRTTDSYAAYFAWIKKVVGFRDKAMDILNQTVAVKDVQRLDEFIRRHMLETKPWKQAVESFGTIAKGLSSPLSIGSLHSLPNRIEREARERFRSRLQTKVLHEIGLLNGNLESDFDEIRDKIAQLNSALTKLDWNPGTHMRLELADNKDREIQDFRMELRHCLSSSFEGTTEANDSIYRRVEVLVAKLGDEAAVRWREKVVDVHNLVRLRGSRNCAWKWRETQLLRWWFRAIRRRKRKDCVFGFGGCDCLSIRPRPGCHVQRQISFCDG